MARGDIRSASPEKWPSYADLLRRKDAPPGSSWRLFGDKSDLGTLNFIGEEQILEAKNAIHRGVVFNLDYPLNAYSPPTARTRSHPDLTIFSNGPNHRDDRVDSLYPGVSSHIDGLRHARHAEHGFYNGASDADIAADSGRLGVQQWAEQGIVGRAVVADVSRFLIASGRPIDHRKGGTFPIDVVDEALRSQGSSLRRGDILLLHTGWARHFFADLDQSERDKVPSLVHSVGLEQTERTLAWLWDNQISAVMADNVSVEGMPPIPNSQFNTPAKRAAGGWPVLWDMMHDHLIAMLGLLLGELWNLDGLAADCARDGRYEAFLAAKPIGVVGGVSSPANAVAIK